MAQLDEAHEQMDAKPRRPCACQCEKDQAARARNCK